MTIVELKAQAYDLLANIQHLQKELDKTNQAIANHINEENKLKSEVNG